MTSWLGGQRSRWALALSIVVFFWLGCSDGGGGSSGAARTASDPAPSQPAPTPPPPDDGGSVPRVYAVMAWAPASGPVKGYRVFVEWDGSGSFEPYEDTATAATFIEGDVGQSIRMQVAALDAQGAEGPRSPASKTIVFTSRMPPANASSAAALSKSDADSTAADDTAARPAPDRPAPEEELAAAPGASGDLDGDGRPDLLWESQDGRMLRITGVDLSVWHELGRPGADWSLAGQGDVDGDGRSDLWWQSATGDVAITRGSSLLARPAATPLEPWARLEPGEAIEEIADYDGDGLADALVGDADGGTLWLTRDSVFELVALTSPEPDARRAATAGDLDGDGNVDLVWLLASGDLLVQFLTAGRVDGVGAIPATGEPIASVAVDAGGADQLVFRALPGFVTRGLRGDAQPWGASLPDEAVLVGCADYDGDGAGDLLWHADGALHFAYLPGEGVVAEPPGWRVVPLCP